MIHVLRSLALFLKDSSSEACMLRRKSSSSRDVIILSVVRVKYLLHSSCFLKIFSNSSSFFLCSFNLISLCFLFASLFSLSFTFLLASLPWVCSALLSSGVSLSSSCISLSSFRSSFGFASSSFSCILVSSIASCDISAQSNLLVAPPLFALVPCSFETGGGLTPCPSVPADDLVGGLFSSRSLIS